MEVEEATVDQLIDELKTRPITFVMAGIEDVPAGGDWIKWSDDQDPLQAIKFLCLAQDYLCYMTDYWDDPNYE